ncbi:hypothetical protein [Shewanella baltica]|nr:hypothetical protein [Shewanella baltica]
MSAERMLALAIAINNALSNKIPLTLPAMKMRELCEIQRICVELNATKK